MLLHACSPSCSSPARVLLATETEDWDGWIFHMRQCVCVIEQYIPYVFTKLGIFFQNHKL